MRKTLLLLPFLLAAALTGAAAQEEKSSLLLELNSVQPSEKGCRFTFVVVNKLGAELSRAAFEVALFNDKGVVDRLSVLDFNGLPDGKTKVTRFEIPGTDCAKVSRVLVNGATECQGAGIEPAACMRNLATASKAAIEFGV